MGDGAGDDGGMTKLERDSLTQIEKKFGLGPFIEVLERNGIKVKICGNCKNYVGGVSWPGDTQVCLLPDPPPSDWMAPDWDNLGFFGSCRYFQPKESSEKPRVLSGKALIVGGNKFCC